ncbi:N-formylglutamate amidohydrolase [Sphingomonas jatrophae]|uniref:N-formylglutamate amidohydrolase n=1 Tax=Sphingomonas jatrophae TaxID=1166337 RepID=A0A1I6JT07_9SPHN|nr:N-formylglutamate amidohydrolase [Sphingomonas jatrophae]SFR82119.1 N-formylglutamate amidohydrolase [Sphingomonas jatrophae]
MPPAAPFIRFGPADPVSPVIVAVPHAGRVYPPALLRAARLPLDLLEMLEDRHADRLASEIVAGGATVFVATMARAWIDLNRGPGDLDPAMVSPPPPGLVAGPRARGGLGLIPRRVAGFGEVYGRPLAAEDVSERLAAVHGSWHDALAETLAAARRRFGVALLLDLHSMPPLPGHAAPTLVIGDRHRTSAAPHHVATALRAAREAGGGRVALNAPYAGGHTLERHGRPGSGIHAIQLELCRSLYLDPARRSPGPGLPAATRLVGRIWEALDADLRGVALAAE